MTTKLYSKNFQTEKTNRDLFGFNGNSNFCQNPHTACHIPHASCQAWWWRINDLGLFCSLWIWASSNHSKSKVFLLFLCVAFFLGEQVLAEIVYNCKNGPRQPPPPQKKKVLVHESKRKKMLLGQIPSLDLTDKLDGN